MMSLSIVAAKDIEQRNGQDGKHQGQCRDHGDQLGIYAPQPVLLYHVQDFVGSHSGIPLFQNIRPYQYTIFRLSKQFF